MLIRTSFIECKDAVRDVLSLINIEFGVQIICIDDVLVMFTLRYVL